ncbi:MAG: hypothetical protein J7K61_05150 [Thermoplasmata archaeon]|nr:hypothetical protein [Thermoplasmata archaeon]
MRIRIRKKYLFYILGATSALISSGVTTIDSYISNSVITDPWTLCLVVFIAGVPITFLISAFLSLPINKKSIGSRIDPSFKKLRLVKKEELKYHIVAAFGNAVTTIAYFMIISLYKEPSSFLSFYQIVILYLLVIESLAEKNAPTLAEVESAMIVTFGAVLASLSLKGEINWLGLAIVFLVLNPSWVLFSIYQRKLKLMKFDGEYNDSINIRFWNLVFTTVITFAILYSIDVFTGTNHVMNAIKAMKYWHWLFLSMGVTFFAYILYIRALGMGKASVTQAVTSLSIAFSIPYSLLLADTLHIVVFESSLHAIIKIMGIILVVMGVISFALTEVKGYLFIRLKSGYEASKVISKIWEIKGITNVAAVTGNCDIVAKVRIRTLGKGYERIIRTLEKVKEIDSFRWDSILKEWEEI